MHVALGNPDILETIFGYCSKKSNSMNISVCSSWFEPSKANLWRSVLTTRELEMFISLLGPLVLAQTVPPKFVRRPHA